MNRELLSDSPRHGAFSDSDPVMADQTTHHVVNSDRSTGEQSSVDAHAKQLHQDTAPHGDQTFATTNSATAPSLHLTDSANPNAPPTASSGSAADLPSAGQQSVADGKPAGDVTLAPEQRQNGLTPSDVNGGQDGGHATDEGNPGSDTDTSRAGSVDQSKEDNRHLRSNSAKKPTSFKAVSVTKTFLAKTAGATPPPPKLGDKSPVASTLQPVAKPRLVAKSGSSMRDVPRVRPTDGAGAPDGKMVWNKNQPVPLPPPKQFTDEELKQQYGIHLASRLQEDEQDGKSKWADEDDDEEDWAPETVEWMDGTKSTVNAAEQQPPTGASAPAGQSVAAGPPAPTGPPMPPTDAPKATEQKAEDQAPPTKPNLTALKKPTVPTTPTTTASMTTKTILRPGAAQLARQNGLGSMGAAEKQTLVAKATPTPVKSPWAPLPPVDKAPPVVVNPPSVPQQPPRFAQRDPHGFDSFSNSNNHLEPAREIAADTFDRSTWRESERANRELFNSQSGRYEPAPEYRRGSRQQDAFRQPAVLQRSSHQSGSFPAEPSAAFQTRSSAQMDGSSFGRRRGSSVSTGSAFPRDRRLSAAKVPELHPNQDEVHNGAAVSSDTGLPLSVPEAVAQPVTAQPVDQGPPAATLEDEIARQKKVLQESREAAKRRKQEEWEREEAEKKERIRKRLEALSAASASTKPEQESTTDQTKPAPEESVAETSPEAPVASTPHLEAQASQTAPQTSPLKSSPRKQRLGESGAGPFNQNQSPFSSRPLPKATFEEPQLPGLKQHSPQQTTRVPYQRQPPTQGSTQAAANSNFSPPSQNKAQPVRMQPVSNLPNSDSFPLWSSGGMPTHTSGGSNVWGPPTNNRHIGNGTFDTGYSRISPGQLQQTQSAPFAGQPPFGRQYGSRISPQGFGDQRMGSATSVDMHGVEASDPPQINGTSPLPETAIPAYQPAPIAPPQKAGARLQNQQPRDTSAWTNFAMQAHQRDRDEVARLSSERRGQPGAQQRWTETYKQTQLEDGWLGGSRKLVGTEQTVHDIPAEVHALGSPAPPVSQTSIAHHLTSPGSSMSDRRHTPGQSTVRLPTGPSSLNRSFHTPGGTTASDGRVTPHGVYPGGVQPLPPPPMTPTSAPQQSRFFPSALYGGSPPPEEADHPVRGGDTRHPHVRLPNAKPKVKLPPAPSASQSKPGPVVMPQRMPSYTVGAQPLVANQDWQARFNGLFGRAQVNTTTPPSPPKTPPKPLAPSPAVAPASKVTMDFALTTRVPTTVSIPQTRPARFEAVSKPGVDDIFDGELSFGSTPRVFLPRFASYAEAPAANRASRPNTKVYKLIEVRSKPELPYFILDNSKSEVIRMKLPQPWAIAKEIPFQRKHQPVKLDPQPRKVSAKQSKPKRHGSAANSGGISESSKATSPASRGAGNKEASIQKSKDTTPDQSAMTPPLSATGQASAGNENAPKRGNFSKTSRGRGGNSAYKSRA